MIRLGELLTEGSTDKVTYDDVYDEYVRSPEFKSFKTKIQTLVSRMEDKVKKLVDSKEMEKDSSDGYSEMFNDLVDKIMKQVTY